MGVAINFNAIQQVRMDKCIVNSYKNFIRQYVTYAYLVKNASIFKNFVVDIINMFKPGKVIINYYTQIFVTVDMFIIIIIITARLGCKMDKYCVLSLFGA